MIVDANLETLTSWEKHVGPDIGGVPPLVYGWNQTADAMEFYTNGPAYSDWLAALHRPVLPGTLQSLSFELMVDGDSPMASQAIEIDTKLAIGGHMYDFSSQFNYAEGGMWQIVNAKELWVDTGFRPGRFQPDIWYPIRFGYGYNLGTKQFSVLNASVGVKQFKVSTALQNIPAAPSNWADSVSLQVQLDIAKQTGQYAIYMRNIDYYWQ